MTSSELELNWQATSVGAVVDMAIMSRAEVFVGNGVSLLPRRLLCMIADFCGLVVFESIEQRGDEAVDIRDANRYRQALVEWISMLSCAF